MAEEEQPHYLGHRQRLRERLLDSGAPSLPDYELLEFLLFSAKPRGDVKPLAKRLIQRFGSFASVLSADAESLKAVPEMGEASVATLKAVQEAAQRLLRAEIRDKPVINSWDKVLDYCNSLGFAEVEEFHLLFLDRKNALIADEMQQRGTIDQTPVYPREVVKRALEVGASSVIMVHNHPSGDPQPSRADIAMTQNVAKALSAVGMTLHDHVIVARGKHLNFKSLGLI